MSGIVVRFRLPSSPRARFFAVSAVVHAALAAAVVFFPILGPRGGIPDELPMVVDLVGDLPSPAAASPVPTSPAVPEPEVAREPEPEPEGARVEPADVKPKPEPEKNKEPENKREPNKPEPRDKTQERVPPAMPPSTGPSTGPPGPATGGPASITSLGLDDLELAWYRDSVVAALQTAWVRPVLEASRESFEVTVAFDIRRDGSVRDARVESPSGVASLDRSALRAVADAAPFPPLPSSWREPVVPARFVFRLHPSAP